MNIQRSLGLLGFGNMGQAIVGGLLGAGAISGRLVLAFDLDRDKQDLAKRFGATVTMSPEDLAAQSEILILAVKPQNMDEALRQIQSWVLPDALVISIAAGISIAYIQKRLGEERRIVRVMPNTPAMAGAGAAGFACSATCTDEDKACARLIFESLGTAELVSEPMLDTVTALSGSGPAYFFYFVECMTAAAEKQGMPHAQACRLAAQTLLGAGRLLTESKESAASLRARVTSKGGTTEAALKVMEEMGMPAVIQQAMDAAAQRARELSGE